MMDMVSPRSIAIRIKSLATCRLSYGRSKLVGESVKVDLLVFSEPSSARIHRSGNGLQQFIPRMFADSPTSIGYRRSSSEPDRTRCRRTSACVGKRSRNREIIQLATRGTDEGRTMAIPWLGCTDPCASPSNCGMVRAGRFPKSLLPSSGTSAVCRIWSSETSPRTGHALAPCNGQDPSCKMRVHPLR